MATLLPTNLYGESGARFIGTGGSVRMGCRYSDESISQPKREVSQFPDGLPILSGSFLMNW